MEKVLRVRQDLQARARAAASKAATSTPASQPAPAEAKVEVDLIGQIVTDFTKHVHQSADRGLWECRREFPALDDEDILAVASEMKISFPDVMIISYLGIKEVRISWPLTNEV